MNAFKERSLYDNSLRREGFIRSGCRKRGSFTVEVALIMPVILSIIVMFIHAALVFYDRCIMEYVCQTACAGAVYDDRPGEGLEEYIREELSENLIRKWDISIDTGADDECITAQIAASGPFFDTVFTHQAKAYKHFCHGVKILSVE